MVQYTFVLSKHEFFPQGVVFMMKVVEVDLDGHLQCRVFFDNTINIMLVINMEENKMSVTSNKSNDDLQS